MSQRFSYVKYDDQSCQQQAELKTAFESVEALVEKLEDGRAKSLVLTHLEIAYMWTGKQIRDTQISKRGACAEQPERNNE